MKRLTIVVATLALSAAALTVDAQQPVRPTAARTVSGESAGTVGPSASPKKTAGMPTEITLQRETFAYSGGGRRDPYKSLMSSSDVRPLLSDLRLTAVAFDPVGAGSNSVAILRDTYSKQQYRVRVGQQLGRLRVSAIRQKAVQFTIEEFGFNRQETLPLSSDTTKVRNP
ncbi:hypothetical protein [Gemmatimonas groenlandica]|uniref:Pilus assembly protein PilP n=1 Tax=Gemmatimonas groenlandica TaxID=2732249 RepID=A0A6M4IGX8_9BACT|nr:hypothetical protein [Gemmatimonas groenlandica]QJR34354.1 hypothetical protein HKW67_01850 [Gemmatimonas groenlandica]